MKNDKTQKARQRIEDWLQAYPEDIFPPPTSEQIAKAHAIFKTNSEISLSLFSVHAMRHVLKGLNEILTALIDEFEKDN